MGQTHAGLLGPGVINEALVVLLGILSGGLVAVVFGLQVPPVGWAAKTGALAAGGGMLGAVPWAYRAAATAPGRLLVEYLAVAALTGLVVGIGVTGVVPGGVQLLVGVLAVAGSIAGGYVLVGQAGAPDLVFVLLWAWVLVGVGAGLLAIWAAIVAGTIVLPVLVGLLGVGVLVGVHRAFVGERAARA